MNVTEKRRYQCSILGADFIALSNYDQNIELHQLLRASASERFKDFIGLPPGSVRPDGSAIVGESGYLFVNDGSNAWKDQLSGSRIISDDELQSTLSYLQSTQSRCHAKGMRFGFVVYPEKDIVYPEFSPNVNGQIYSDRTVIRIQRHSAVNVIYPAQAMIAEKFYTQQFHRRNSHVQFYGGLVAANEVLSAFGFAQLEICDVHTDTVCWPDDLSIKWVDGLHTDRRRVLPIFERVTVVQPATGHVGTRLEFTNKRAPIDQTVLIFGDSYSWNPDAGLASFLALKFRKVHFIWTKLVDWNLLEELDPSIVLLESAERFLVRGLK